MTALLKPKFNPGEEVFLCRFVTGRAEFYIQKVTILSSALHLCMCDEVIEDDEGYAEYRYNVKSEINEDDLSFFSPCPFLQPINEEQDEEKMFADAEDIYESKYFIRNMDYSIKKHLKGITIEYINKKIMEERECC